jgi:enoyl-CoA hydratase/carnithine racemase
MKPVTLSIEDGIAQVRLNRPDYYNALSAEAFEALVETAREIDSEPTVRAVVLAGEGGNFCSGIDFNMFTQTSDPEELIGQLMAPISDSPANLAQESCYAWRQLKAPVIAALEGTVFGAGLQLALACDIRIAAADAQLSVMEIRWGLIPDLSITQTLPRLVRDDVARELTYTGRIVEAEEARNLGLVTRVSETPQLAANNLAEQIVGNNPAAIKAAKKLYTDSWHATPDHGLGQEADLQKTLLGTPNQMEAAMANMQRREPHFDD